MSEVFKTLNNLNVNDRVEEKKTGKVTLSYLSWAWAWAEVKKIYPKASYNVHKFGEKNKPYLLDEDLGYMVFTDVTIEDVTHEMWLPVLDGANKAMKNKPYTYPVINWTNGKRDGFIDKEVSQATMFDINTSIMRCLVKNLAMHGLGLYIYAGEDLPTEEKDELLKPKLITTEQIKKLGDLLDEKRMIAMLGAYKLEDIKDMKEETANATIERLEKEKKEKEVTNINDIV